MNLSIGKTVRFVCDYILQILFKGFLKDHYGKYDYAYYFGGVAVVLGSFVLAYGNLRNWRQTRRETNSNDHERNGKLTSGNKG